MTPREPVPPPKKECNVCGDVFRRGEDQTDQSWRRTLSCDPCAKKRGRGKPFGTPNHQDPPFETPKGLERDWRERAACRGLDAETGEDFFPLGNDWNAQPNLAKVARAKAVCARCPVAAACLDDAVASRDAWSIRGGLTPKERSTLFTKAGAA